MIIFNTSGYLLFSSLVWMLYVWLAYRMPSTVQWVRKRGIKRLNVLISVMYFISGTFGIWTQSLNHFAILFTKWANWPKVPPQLHLLPCLPPSKLYYGHSDSLSALGTHEISCPSQEGFPGPPNLKWKPLYHSILSFSLWTFMGLLVCFYTHSVCPPHTHFIHDCPPRTLPFPNRYP